MSPVYHPTDLHLAVAAVTAGQRTARDSSGCASASRRSPATPPARARREWRMHGRTFVRPPVHDPSSTGQETAMTVETLEDIGELAQQLRVDSIRCSTAAG